MGSICARQIRAPTGIGRTEMAKRFDAALFEIVEAVDHDILERCGK
jgi:hypothetical protein